MRGILVLIGVITFPLHVLINLTVIIYFNGFGKLSFIFLLLCYLYHDFLIPQKYKGKYRNIFHTHKLTRKITEKEKRKGVLH